MLLELQLNKLLYSVQKTFLKSLRDIIVQLFYSNCLISDNDNLKVIIMLFDQVSNNSRAKFGQE